LDLGVLGGTFNPIHLGHLRAAEEVREALGLERVLFVPARVPPHKAAAEVAPPAVRLRMVRRAIEGNRCFEVSDLELRREGPSYSVDTLAALRAGLGAGDRLWLLVGADAFREIHTWWRFADLFSLADVAVMRRPPEDGPLPPPRGMEGDFQATGGGYVHASGREIRFVPVTLLDISSTRIRKALSEGRSARYLVPDAVLAELRDFASTTPPQEGAHG
jgi:nicotinate-nucleotide adenylyltransferase